MYQGNCALSLESHWEKLAANDETASGELVHTDHLGTPRAVSNAGQNVVWEWNSDPFGATAANDDPDTDGTPFTFNLRFPGQYYDSETGLHYNYFRYYDPSTGRYITSDPIGLQGGLNTYAYVRSNPLKYIDPKGLDLVPDPRGGLIPHKHSYPDGRREICVPSYLDPGCSSWTSPDHYNQPKCTVCGPEFAGCIAGASMTALSCTACAASEGVWIPACAECVASGFEAAACYIQYCEIGRQTTSGECKKEACE